MATLPSKKNISDPRPPQVVSLRQPDMTGVFGTGQGAQAIAQGLGSLGNDLMNVALERQKDRDATDTLYADSERKRRALELRQSVTSNPNNYATATRTFQDGMRKIDQETGALIRNPEVRNKWRLSLNSDEQTNAVYEWSDGIDKQNQKARGEVAVQNYSDQYADPTLSNRARYDAMKHRDEALKALYDRGIITDGELAVWADKYKSQSAKELATAMLSVNPKGVGQIATGKQAFKDWLGAKEGDYHLINRYGFAGKYQFGGQRMKELGVYNGPWSNDMPGKQGKWTGTFNIPGFEDVKTIDQFLANKDAQEAVMDMHIAKMDEEIKALGLEKWIGTRSGDIEMTREGMYAAIHLGGGQGLVKALETGRFKADANGTTALDYIKAASDHNFFKDVTPADRAILAKKADDEVRLNDIQVGIADGSLSRADVEAAMPGFDYNDQQKIERAWTAQEKKNEADRFTQMVTDPKWIPNPADPDHNKALDAAWLGEDEAGHQRLIARDTDYFNANVLPLVATKRVIPPRLKGTLEAMTSSTDPHTLVYALDRMSDLESVAPTAWARDMNADMQQLLVRYRESLSVYTPEEIAEKIAGEAGNAAQKKTNEALVSEAKTEAGKLAPYVAGIILTGQAPGTALGRAVIGGINYVRGAPMPEGPEREAMEQDFIEVFSRAMEKTGDKSLALKMTIPVMKQRWWVSNATGEKRWMRWAPEMFNPDGIDPDWIRLQSRARLFPLIGDGPFILQADARTELEMQSGKRATYQVMVPKTLGELAQPAPPSTEGYEIVGMRESKKP